MLRFVPSEGGWTSGTNIKYFMGNIQLHSKGKFYFGAQIAFDLKCVGGRGGCRVILDLNDPAQGWHIDTSFWCPAGQKKQMQTSAAAIGPILRNGAQNLLQHSGSQQ